MLQMPGQVIYLFERALSLVKESDAKEAEVAKSSGTVSYPKYLQT